MSCITEILKLKGDKEALVPEGNWIAVEGGGTFKGFEYLVVLNQNGHRCGYVALTPEHPYSKTPEEERTFISGRPYTHYDYDSLEISCHGGLTFMSPTHGLKELLTIACNDMWIGFDCGHYLDACDTKSFQKYFGEEAFARKDYFFNTMTDPEASIRDFDYVEHECQSIIDQLIEAA